MGKSKRTAGSVKDWPIGKKQLLFLKENNWFGGRMPTVLKESVLEPNLFNIFIYDLATKIMDILMKFSDKVWKHK